MHAISFEKLLSVMWALKVFKCSIMSLDPSYVLICRPLNFSRSETPMTHQMFYESTNNDKPIYLAISSYVSIKSCKLTCFFFFSMLWKVAPFLESFLSFFLSPLVFCSSQPRWWIFASDGLRMCCLKHTKGTIGLMLGDLLVQNLKSEIKFQILWSHNRCQLLSTCFAHSNTHSILPIYPSKAIFHPIWPIRAFDG